MGKKRALIGLVLYRFNKDILEVFLVNNDKKDWQLPTCETKDEKSFEHITGISTHDDDDDVISLSPIDQTSDILDKVYALEEKFEYCAQKFVEIQEAEGTYVAVKEAFKKVLPHEYEVLHELKDILLERNSIKSI